MNKELFSKFTREEITILKKLNTPYKIQEFIDSFKYNTGKRICPLNVLRERKADCVEAAIFASAVLSFHNIKNFLVTLEAVRDEDHLLCVYKLGRKYGALAQSKFIGLRNKYPVYDTVRELVMSYFEHYFNFFGEPSLRRYSVPYKLKSDFKWLYNNKEIYKIDKETSEIKFHSILNNKKRLPRVNKLRFHREILIFPEKIRIGKRYKEKTP
jgi:hypothetical protein